MDPIDYQRQLLNGLMPVVSLLVSEVMGCGVDSNGRRALGQDARLAAVPETLEVLARWSRDNAPGTEKPAETGPKPGLK